MKNFAPDQLKWIRKPDKFSIQDDFISINTAPYTDRSEERRVGKECM